MTFPIDSTTLEGLTSLMKGNSVRPIGGASAIRESEENFKKDEKQMKHNSKKNKRKRKKNVSAKSSKRTSRENGKRRKTKTEKGNMKQKKNPRKKQRKQQKKRKARKRQMWKWTAVMTRRRHLIRKCRWTPFLVTHPQILQAAVTILMSNCDSLFVYYLFDWR